MCLDSFLGKTPHCVWTKFQQGKRQKPPGSRMSLWLSPKIRNQAENHRFTPSGKWRNLFPKIEQRRHCLQPWAESCPLSCNLAHLKTVCGREFGRAWQTAGVESFTLARQEYIQFLSLGLDKTIFATEYKFLLPVSISNLMGRNASEMQFSLGCNGTVKESRVFLEKLAPLFG